MDCPMCSGSMEKVEDLHNLPACPYDWIRYSNYLDHYQVWFCYKCNIMLSFSNVKLIMYHVKNIIKEAKRMLGF